VIASSLRNVYGDPNKVTPELIDLFYDITRREGNREALVKRFEQAPATGFGARVAEVMVPTLILWGGRDRLIPPDHAERFRRDIVGSHVVMFDDLGHVPHEEDPVRTVTPVLAFLAMH
jgi:pimeloyl-ACP methyl ester carboxylesterase